MKQVDWFEEYLLVFEKIETRLIELELWSSEHPGEDALQSSMPFCVDTLRLEQWLQFVFLPRMRRIVKRKELPPGPAQIAPIAQEAFKETEDSEKLIRAIQKFDEVSHLSHLH
ncbi:YqcC family protein [Kangiella shandongensis]|uniref:YqcC family protein n=1 Tax=Kangiella shandongensis TaxID=2763258 RepID=UPI001CBAD7AC|nr:YqcC family protein [Kangiella shandongensis]